MNSFRAKMVTEISDYSFGTLVYAHALGIITNINYSKCKPTHKPVDIILGLGNIQIHETVIYGHK